MLFIAETYSSRLAFVHKLQEDVDVGEQERCDTGPTSTHGS